MKLPEPPQLRELDRGNEQEVNLILSGWLRTYVGSKDKPSSVDLTIERSVMYRLYQPLVKDLLARSNVLVACDPAEPDIIYGWMAWSDDVLQYVCTKVRWQRLGIASWLLKDFAGMDVRHSHRTKDGDRLVKGMAISGNWQYSPMLRFGENRQRWKHVED